MNAYDEMRTRLATSKPKTSIVPHIKPRHQYKRVFMRDVQTPQGQRYFDVMACEKCPYWWAITTTYDNTGHDTIDYRPRQDGVKETECKG